ncbi:MAG: M14 family zinc carboxypeptidase [Burkholderiaceae bacterium]
MDAGSFPELVELERILEDNACYLESRQLGEIVQYGHRFPLYALCLGNPSKQVPAVGFFGGVHGLEKIGTKVLLTYLKNLVTRLRWDHLLHEQLNSVRLVFMPIVNPAGMWRCTRSNSQGVDLMRNAPIDAVGKVPLLIGGQRISCHLPWFRGAADAPMEAECNAVCRIVQEELLDRDFSMVLDCHSGFGMHDRIWFPFAYTKQPIPHLAEILALENLFTQNFPHHPYVFEPQSSQYLTHGDLWDFLYLCARKNQNRIFLPLTLEMGSWRWVKKSPWQLFSRKGMFNPLPLHRLNRVLRRHLFWFDFLMRAACEHMYWLPRGMERTRHQEAAYDRWYRSP